MFELRFPLSNWTSKLVRTMVQRDSAPSTVSISKFAKATSAQKRDLGIAPQSRFMHSLSKRVKIRTVGIIGGT